VGVSANILDASWQALADGLRYALFHSASNAAPNRERQTSSPA